MNIIIVDDDPFVCMSLQTILSVQDDIQVLATGASGDDAIRLYRDCAPDILLMDIQMQPVSGLAAGEAILRESPDARILFLTTFSDSEYITQALRIGARGYLIKQDIEGIAPALRAVMSGQSVFGGQVMSKLQSLTPESRDEGLPLESRDEGLPLEAAGLSERELQVLRLVADGRSNREIAGALYLSEGTVRNYISTMLDKLQLRDRTQLAVYYYKNGGKS